MDWMNRGNSPTQAAPAAGGAAGAPAPGHRGGGKVKKAFGGLKLASVVLLFSATALVVAAIWLLSVGPKNEASYVDKNKMQAVFLNGGQVYFGKVTNLDNKFLRLTEIYYLRVNQQVQPNQEGNNQAAQNDISLVKLGCELHGPVDEMLINREQVIFWENLKEDGQVAKAVAEYVKQNPDGQKCQEAAPQGNAPAQSQTNQNNQNGNNQNNTNNQNGNSGQ
jgi:hypothetical protein